MHLHHRARLFVFALITILIAPVFTHGASAEQTKTVQPSTQARPRFQLSVEPVEPLELQGEARKLDSLREQLKRNTVSEYEVGNQKIVVQNLARRMTYLITLRSEGGTLGELVKVTSNTNTGVSLTLINATEPSDLDAKLPAFTLQRVHWGTIVEVLSKLLVSQGLELSYSGGDSPNPSEAKSVICVLRRAAPPGANGSVQSTFAALGLSEYLTRDQTVDTITDAIRTAWKMDPKHDVSALQLQFHPSTKILLVSGPYPAAAIAREIVETLPKKKAPLY